MSFSFSLARLPRIEFGSGVLAKLPGVIRHYGTRALLVTGAKSFAGSGRWNATAASLRVSGVEWQVLTVAGEPSPEFIDEAVKVYRSYSIDVVVGIGGGSALDAAKAIAGLLKPGNSVMDHLEGVGPELPYTGPSVPFIAVPTTAGTGSEATKNAVLSRHGPDGFKKSFRDEKLVAEYAFIDPDLLESCPPAVIAANGMDALTQLLESFVSSKANPLTDALAVAGMNATRDSLMPWFMTQGSSSGCRERMAYAALLSGITLAQVGLGSVHGLAAPLGAFFPIPHGVACGTLVAEATRVNIQAMTKREPKNAALAKYAQAGRVMAGNAMPDEEARSALIDILEDLTERMTIPRLAAYGVTSRDIPRLVANCRGSSMKTNPIVLRDEEIADLIEARM